MTKRRIIDAHHHLWDLGRSYSYSWLQDRPLGVGVCGDVTAIARDYLVAEYSDDTATYDLVSSVHIEAVAIDPIAETTWLQPLADAGLPGAIVARAELNAPDIEKVLAAQAAFPAVRGIRHIVNWHKTPRLTFTDRDDFLRDPAWRAGFKLLSKYGLSFDLQLYPSQMEDAYRLATDHPDTLIILNHAGMPVDRDVDSLKLWHDGMRRLATAPNVVAKVSGLGMVDWNWTPKTIRPFVRYTIDAFGTDRVMFGSNFPVDKLYSSFETLYRAFEAITADLSAEDQDKLFHANARTHYHL
jgi:predicted TIM-barrel fold metal-dependent hydrolase